MDVAATTETAMSEGHGLEEVKMRSVEMTLGGKSVSGGAVAVFLSITGAQCLQRGARLQSTGAGRDGVELCAVFSNTQERTDLMRRRNPGRDLLSCAIEHPERRQFFPESRFQME